MSDTLKNIYQRILGVMNDISYIQKGDKKVNGQYSFVSHDAVTGALHPLMVKHGIVVVTDVLEAVQDGNRTTVKVRVSFVNVDTPDDVVSVSSVGYGIDNGDKGVGKGISYATKYALLKTFLLETGDDPDNNANAVHEPEKITEEQVMEISNLISQSPMTISEFLEIAKISDVRLLDKTKFNAAVQFIKSRQTREEG